ncbi:MAG: DUF4365 domain-containing protein [Candidatus Electrothrix sp. AR1]|nr:DUF4365 domain-containing protein [Candidatus Electrothrix sp. AR1]
MKAQKTDRTERMGVGIAMTAFEALDFAFREQSESDYGIDAHAELIQSEQPTGQLLGIQIKSGASFLDERCDIGFVFRLKKAEHVNYWLNHALPVLICLCDVETKNVYWQVVTPETAISTGKGYKFIFPATQLINSSSREPLRKAKSKASNAVMAMPTPIRSVRSVFCAFNELISLFLQNDLIRTSLFFGLNHHTLIPNFLFNSIRM